MVLVNTRNYSFINGLYYICVDAICGFVAFFLLANGVSNSVIGVMIASVGIINFFLQPILGNALDRSRKINHLQVICILAALCFSSGLCIVFFSNIKLCLILFLGFSMITLQLIMPIINSLSAIWGNKGYKINFGIARGIGSISYAIASFAIGYLSDDAHFGPKFIPISICVFTGLLLLVMLVLTPKLSKLSSDTYDEKKSQSKKSAGFSKFVSKYWKFLIFIAGSILVFSGHNVITNFSVNVLMPLNGGGQEVGIMSGIAAACELPTMFLFSRINKKFHVSKLVMVGGIFFTLKLFFCLVAFMLGSVGMLYAVQVLQMLGYALFIPASVIFTSSVISEEFLTFGQALVTAASTAGGIIGSNLGGTLLDAIGVKSMLIVAVILSAIGSVVIIISVNLIKRAK